MSGVNPPFASQTYRLDRCRLERLHSPRQALAVAQLLAPIDPWRMLGYQAAELSRYLLRDDAALHRFIIAEKDAELGAVCVRYPWLRGAYLELIGLAPAAQGRGIGGSVLAWMEAETKVQAANVWAFVSQANVPGRQFYARHGFAEIVPVEDLVAPGHAEILLRKQLPG